MWTLAIYLVGTALTALTPKGTGWIIYLYATRFIAGMGIGGEYSAINSAIDEMMPARYRGRTDIWINGTYWLGAIIGTLASFLLLSSMRPDQGWRVAFLGGPALAVVILDRAAQPAREPAVADHPRPRAGGREDDPADRGNRETGWSAPRSGPGERRDRHPARKRYGT